MNKEKLLINDLKSNNSEIMSNKQIEEMAKHCPCYFGGECCFDGELSGKCDRFCQFGTYAEALYNAGYRKQGEGRWEKPSMHSDIICSQCKRPPKMLFGVAPLYCPNCGAKMKGE